MVFHGPMRHVWFLNGIIASILVIAFACIGFFPKVEAGRDVRVLQLGLLVLDASSLNQSLASINLLPERSNWEPVGMVFLLCTAGYVSAVCSLRTEQNWMTIGNELEIARRIQLSILPQEMPQTTALQVAARYVPLTAVAGNSCHLLIVDRDGVGIWVADVSGHGVPAALIAPTVQITIAAQMPHAEDPARVLSSMNQTLCGKLQV